MSKITVITISGEICTGKSTLTNTLLKHLPEWTRINTGKRFREICAKHGMTIQDVSLLPDEIHKEFDELQRSLALTETNIIIEGRLAGWLTQDIKHTFRVFCKAPIDIRAQRYILRENTTYTQAVSDINHRDHYDMLKFRDMYGVFDYRDPDYYSFVVDTSIESPLELTKRIIRSAGLKIN